MEPIEQIKKLDFLLTLFKNEQIVIKYGMIEEMMFANEKGFKTTPFERERYVNQLLEDKLIMAKEVDNTIGYMIRIEGLLSPTYEKKVNDRNRTLVQEQLYKNRLLYATWSAGITAAFLL